MASVVILALWCPSFRSRSPLQVVVLSTTAASVTSWMRRRIWTRPGEPSTVGMIVPTSSSSIRLITVMATIVVLILMVMRRVAVLSVRRG